MDKNNLRLDDLQLKGLRIYQNPSSFCFGIDAVLLSDFAAKRIKAQSRVMDLCTGNGIVPLLLYGKKHVEEIVGVEIQRESAALAKKSVVYNHLEKYITVLNQDLKELPVSYNGVFDAVTVNPPYMQIQHGLQCPGNEKNIARHEICCTLETVLSTAARVLKDKGWLYMVYRPHRLAEAISLLKKLHLEPKLLQMVHPKPGSGANLFLLGAVKGGGVWLDVDTPLVVYDRNGNYTEEINKIYGRSGA